MAVEGGTPYRQMLANRVSARKSAKRKRELAFSSPAPMEPPVKAEPSLFERLSFSPLFNTRLLGGMAEQQAQAKNRFNIIKQAAENPNLSRKERRDIQISAAMESPEVKGFIEEYGGGGVVGSIARVGSGSLIKDILGRSIKADPQKTAEFVLRKGAGLPAKIPSKVEIERYPKGIINIVEELTSPSGKGSIPSTIEQKSKDTLRDIYDTQIGNQPLIYHMEDAGLAPFRSIRDTLLDIPGRSEMAIGSDIRPVPAGTLEAANKSIETMQEFMPTGFDIRGVINPETEKLMPVFQNDHIKAVSIAKNIITNSAERIIRGGGKLTDDWHKSSQDALDFVDDPNNLRRVAAWWNQAKSNKHPDVVYSELKKKYPKLAKIIRDYDHLSEIMDDWEQYDTVLKRIPGGEDIINKAGGLAEYTRQIPSSFGRWVLE